MRCIPLDPGLDGRREAWLRPMTGADEEAARMGVLALLDRCLVEAGPRAVGPGMAADLPLADRDRLLAALHAEAFGERIEADGVCTGCGATYSVAFGLPALSQSLAPQMPDGVTGPDARGRFALGEVTFRLPSSADLGAVAAVAAADRAEALLAACVIEGDAAPVREALEAALEALGPTLDVDLDATCPECGAGQSPRFNIALFLGRSLATERPLLLREVHCIARAYGWSHASILALPRADRRAFVEIICEVPARAVPLERLGHGRREAG